jgi:hypothetical protein
VVRAGWSLVWRRLRLLGWLYALNLALGLFAAAPLASMIGPLLDHSLAADRLYHSFDLPTFAELLAEPAVTLSSVAAGSLLLAVVFLVLMLLLTGGILKVYNEDRTFTTGEFFAAGGEFFWRFLRLMIFLLVVLVPIVLINQGFRHWSDSLADRYAPPAAGMFVNGAGKLLVLFLLMAVRLWFDMAEVQAVAEGEYAMRRSLARAGRLTWRNFGSLFWIYFPLSLLTWVGTAVILWVWIKFVPHRAIAASFLLTQAIIFLWILTRLWQRASETLWYQQRAPSPAVPPEIVPISVTPPAPPILEPETPAEAPSN